MRASTRTRSPRCNTAFLQDGAFVYVPDGVDAVLSRSTCSSSSLPGSEPHGRPPAEPDRRRATEPGCRSSRRYVGLGSGAVSHQRGDRGGRRRRTRSLEHDKLQMEGRAGVSRRARSHASSWAGSTVTSNCDLARRVDWCGTRSTAVLDGRGVRMHAERPLPRDGRRSSSTTTRRSTTRSRTARATSCTRRSSTARRAASSTARSSSGKDAQKTDAKQTNKTLLLSDDATIDTKPQLEIFADDVKCTHGATVGQLDEDQVFYLRARGIDEAGRARHADLRLCGRCRRPHPCRAAPASSSTRLLHARLHAGTHRTVDIMTSTDTGRAPAASRELLRRSRAAGTISRSSASG